MVNQLQQIWKGSSWLKRYSYSSKELNMRLAGLGKQLHKSMNMWTKPRIRACMAYMRRASHVLATPQVLYRGTSHPGIEIHADEDSLVPDIAKNTCIVSLTTSRAIAKEFAWPKGKGFLHKVCLAKGCRVVDMVTESDHAARREKEVLLLPGHSLKLVSQRGHSLVWQCTAHH